VRFWDSSALTPLLLNEPTTVVVRRLRAADPAIVLWWATPVECASALARRVRDGQLTPGMAAQATARMTRLLATVRQVQPTDRVRDEARRLLNLHSLRAADALQLAAAVVWAGHRPSGAELVCLDQRLRSAAQGEGFSILPT
jgi:hypothetical protein